jgi:hypothetical protein
MMFFGPSCTILHRPRAPRRPAAGGCVVGHIVARDGKCVVEIVTSVAQGCQSVIAFIGS